MSAIKTYVSQKSVKNVFLKDAHKFIFSQHIYKSSLPERACYCIDKYDTKLEYINNLAICAMCIPTEQSTIW